MVKICGEFLHGGFNGVFAVCTQEWGMEHSHNDLTVEQAIEQGQARLLTEEEKQSEAFKLWLLS